MTRLLRAWGGGDQAALERLAPLVYDELRRTARRYMRREGPGQTLQATALVNQAWIRLLGGASVTWQDRGHFLAVASQVMRRILVDGARARRTGKRRGTAPHLPFDESLDAAPVRDAGVIALDDALEALAAFDPRKVQVVELRYFGGLSVEETAGTLGVSPQTVMRDWRLARAWLQRQMGAGGA